MDQRYISRELTHFVGASLRTSENQHRPEVFQEEQYALLIKILKSPQPRLYRPSYVPPPQADWLNVNTQFARDTKFNFPYVCFCDIPVGDLQIHMRNFSQFGIAFSKKWLFGKGANPVFYIVNNSLSNFQLDSEPEERQKTFNTMMDAGMIYLSHLQGMDLQFPEIRPIVDKTKAKRQFIIPQVRGEDFVNFLLRGVIQFMKPFHYTEADHNPANAYMEREWRLEGELTFSIEDVQRIIIPERFAQRLRENLPSYCQQVTFAENPG